MKITTIPADFVPHIAASVQVLSDCKDEVNRLNVFPVPDGDTGTNMSLTMEAVLKELLALPPGMTLADICKAITHGSLMGARGNSGVITSQILRGICDGLAEAENFDAYAVSTALDKAVEVAFSAVRKPVEGTILTVLRDVRDTARTQADAGATVATLLPALREAAYASVKRTPELLPILKENGVVDAGGYGLALLVDGFISSITGESSVRFESSVGALSPGKVAIEQINDWEGSAYLYCTEFLLRSTDLDVGAAQDFLAGMGDCELLVGAHPDFKVHVHTNEPGTVLSYMTERGQVAEVHIHNMRLQSEERTAGLEGEASGASPDATGFAEATGQAGGTDAENGFVGSAGGTGGTGTGTGAPTKEFGFVAVSSGEGMAKILRSLGVDQVVSGGQTMNPSTKDLLDAINKIASEHVFIFPNNKNIILTANTAAQASGRSVGVIPTTSVPQSFSALFAADPSASFEENTELMNEAIALVRSGEVTAAIKNAKTAKGKSIRSGDIIGIVDGSIEVVGKKVFTVAVKLVDVLVGQDTDTLTILAGADLAQDEFEQLLEKIEQSYPDLEIDAHRGEQPLYPLVMSAE